MTRSAAVRDGGAIGSPFPQPRRHTVREFAIIKSVPPLLPYRPPYCLRSRARRSPPQFFASVWFRRISAARIAISTNISRKGSMKKIKDHSDDDDFEVDDPDYPEDEGASEEEWTPAPEPGAEVRNPSHAQTCRFLDSSSNSSPITVSSEHDES